MDLATLNGRTMRLPKRDLAILISFSIGAIGTVCAQSATHKLQPLVETSASRLAIARDVAFSKWDARSPVEDTAREAEVIKTADKDADSHGLNPTFVTHFFTAQIEANKLVQYSLLASWHRAGAAPVHRPVNLAADIRPKLDQLEKELLRELVDTAVIRASASCPADTAKAVEIYLSSHKHRADSVLAVALDRAMADTCIF